MATIRTCSLPAGGVEDRERDTAPLGSRPHRRVMREAVIMYGANRRAGTHSTKTRAEVNFSNKKPWAQKHTGRARAGTRRSPLWRKGGVMHGPRPRDHSYTMPRKALKAALRSALLGKLRDGEVFAVEGLRLESPSTKTVASVFRALGLAGSTLLVLEKQDPALWRSARNIEGTTVRIAADVNALDVLAHRNLVVLDGALAALEKGVAS